MRTNKSFSATDPLSDRKNNTMIICPQQGHSTHSLLLPFLVHLCQTQGEGLKMLFKASFQCCCHGTPSTGWFRESGDFSLSLWNMGGSSARGHIGQRISLYIALWRGQQDASRERVGCSPLPQSPLSPPGSSQAPVLSLAPLSSHSPCLAFRKKFLALRCEGPLEATADSWSSYDTVTPGSQAAVC